MIGMNPRVDMVFALFVLLVLVIATYPLWVRQIRRAWRRWRNAVDNAHDDVVDSEYQDRFRRRKDR